MICDNCGKEMCLIDQEFNDLGQIEYQEFECIGCNVIDGIIINQSKAL